MVVISVRDFWSEDFDASDGGAPNLRVQRTVGFSEVAWRGKGSDCGPILSCGPPNGTMLD